MTDAEDRMQAFRMDDRMRYQAGLAIQQTYEGTDYPQLSIDEVISRVLIVAAADARELAKDLTECNKVDDCAASAVVLRHLAAWLDPRPEVGA